MGKGNPYHDPENGEFTFGPGGRPSGLTGDPTTDKALKSGGKSALMRVKATDLARYVSWNAGGEKEAYKLRGGPVHKPRLVDAIIKSRK